MSAGLGMLVLRYMAYHRTKTVILTICLALTFFLPISTRLLIDHFHGHLGRRTEETPLVVGRRGGEYGLVLNALYFSTEPPVSITQGDIDKLRADDWGGVIPIYTKHSARGFSVIGTTYDYFDFRRLRTRVGSLPSQLGEAVVGDEVAQTLDLGPGDTVITDARNPYNLAASYPLKLRVTGILGRTETADDRAVFVDVKTCWIIDGIGHGHDDLDKVPESSVLEREDGHVLLAPSLKLYNEVTPSNIDTFHFMGDPANYPVTCAILVPASDKSRTLWLGRYQKNERLQIVQPSKVIGGLMELVFQVQRVFTGYFALVVAAMSLSVGLVIALSLRLRSRELQTLFRLGCARLTVFKMVAGEIGLVAVTALGLAVGLSVLLIQVVGHYWK